MLDEVMDIDGLSAYLKLAPITLYKMVKEGKIPCRRIGKSLRFPKGMIDRWLNQEEEKKIPSLIEGALTEFAARVRKRLGDRVKKICLYGSWARNEARSDSDIDIVVFIDQKDLTAIREVSTVASEISLETNRPLSAIVIEWEAHQRGKEEEYPFHRQVEQEGIQL